MCSIIKTRKLKNDGTEPNHLALWKLEVQHEEWKAGLKLRPKQKVKLKRLVWAPVYCERLWNMSFVDYRELVSTANCVSWKICINIEPGMFNRATEEAK